MPLGISEEEFMALAEAAQDAGIRIEIAGGLPIFELSPSRLRTAVTQVPTAVVEALSPFSMVKDIELSPTWYLSQGVRDVFVYDPEGLTVDHIRALGKERHSVAVELETEMGCLVGFPQPPED